MLDAVQTSLASLRGPRPTRPIRGHDRRLGARQPSFSPGAHQRRPSGFDGAGSDRPDVDRVRGTRRSGGSCPCRIPSTSITSSARWRARSTSTMSTSSVTARRSTGTRPTRSSTATLPSCGSRAVGSPPGTDAFVLTKHADVSLVVRDPERFLSLTTKRLGQLADQGLSPEEAFATHHNLMQASMLSLASDAAALQPAPQGTHRSVGGSGSAPPPRDDHRPRERPARRVDRRPRGRVHRPVRRGRCHSV